MQEQENVAPATELQPNDSDVSARLEMHALVQKVNETQIWLAGCHSDLEAAQQAGMVATQIDHMAELQANLDELRATQAMLLQARSSVEAEHQRYRELFEFAPHGYLVTDADGIIREANRASSTLLGVAQQSLVGKPLAVFVAAQGIHSFRALLRSLSDCVKMCAWEGQMRRRPNLRFDVSLTAESGFPRESSRSAVGAGKTIRWILQDVTDRKREERTLRAQSEALIKTLHALALEPNLDTFLRQVLTAVGAQLEAREVTLWLYDRPRNQWNFRLRRIMRGESGDDALRSSQLPSEEWRLWHELMQSRQPVIVADLADDARLADYDGRTNPRSGSLLLVPMLLGEDVIGLLRSYNAIKRGYEAPITHMVQALAQQATLAIQMTHLAEREQEQAILQERNRMAQEIHDTLAQGFTGIALQLEAAEVALDRGNGQAIGHIVRARELARRCLAEARQSVYALRPELLEERDLLGAIGRIVEEITAGTSLIVRFQLQGNPRPLISGIEDQLLRIAQEALTNVLKHANAENVDVRVNYGGTELELEILDDGDGFMPTTQRPGSMGVVGMRERCARIGGRFLLDSQPGQGTRISVVVPYA